MFAAIVHDAWRQYRRRPLAAAVSLAVGVAPLAVQPHGEVLQAVVVGALLVPTLLSELFLFAYLAGALAPVPLPVSGALAAMRRAVLPAARAWLLKLVYLLPAWLVGLLLLGAPDSARLTQAQQQRFSVGLIPLLGFALAFLVALIPRIVLDGERRVLAVLPAAHRVAASNFPICLLIGCYQAIGLLIPSVLGSQAALAALAVILALADPFMMGMTNGLYLRTRALHAAEPQPRPSDHDQWP